MEDSEEAAEGHRVLAEELVLQASEVSSSLLLRATPGRRSQFSGLSLLSLLPVVLGRA